MKTTAAPSVIPANLSDFNPAEVSTYATSFLVEYYNTVSETTRPLKAFKSRADAEDRCVETFKADYEIRTGKDWDKEQKAAAKAAKAAKKGQPTVVTVKDAATGETHTVTMPAPKPPGEEVDLKQEKGKRYVSKTDPNSKYHLRDRSEAPKPVSIVRETCEANPTLTRKEIIALCVSKGVNINTAATQYSLWKAKQATTFPGGNNETEE